MEWRIIRGLARVESGLKHSWVAEMSILDSLVNDLKQHGGQSSWDWEADARFAEIIGDFESAKILWGVVHSSTMVFRQLTIVQKTGITKKRLRALRRLVKLGLVESSWESLGAGGRNIFGVGRLRGYNLVSHATQQSVNLT